MPLPLCRVDELQNIKAKSFTVDGSKIFIVRTSDTPLEFSAYINRCPHQLIPLDWDNDQFLDPDEELIQCATHGALFTLDTGKCVAGPCVGEQLEKLELIVSGGNLCLKQL